MRVVSNASPLIALARIGRLDVLFELFGQVLLPEAVWHEVVVEGRGEPGAAEVAACTWISRATVANVDLVTALRQDLDAGEAAAIALALESKADLLIMDERLGRETATHLGLRIVGTVGLLVHAKSAGIVAEIRPLLDAMRDQAGFRVSDDLYMRVLVDAGEIAA